ncbi:MAG TPA: TetR/AcrR family transcriptional regulator [Solimonas sp.]|nr:TetR/AcrR family transcriptional regulator [Solimonas sp.]
MSRKPEAHRRLAAQLTPLPELAGAGSRRVILDAALRLFAERGYGGASVRDLAALSGLQPASLYAHFPSKEHVLAELCRLGHEEFVRGLRAALLDCGPDPRHQVAAYMRAHVSFHAEYSMLAVICNSELHMLSAPMAAPSLALRKQGEDLLTSIIRRGQEHALFDVPHVWLSAAMVGGAGLRVANWYTPEFELGADEVGQVYARFAWRILGVAEDWERPRRARRAK